MKKTSEGLETTSKGLEPPVVEPSTEGTLEEHFESIPFRVHAARIRIGLTKGFPVWGFQQILPVVFKQLHNELLAVWEASGKPDFGEGCPLYLGFAVRERFLVGVDDKELPRQVTQHGVFRGSGGPVATLQQAFDLLATRAEDLLKMENPERLFYAEFTAKWSWPDATEQGRQRKKAEKLARKKEETWKH